MVSKNTSFSQRDRFVGWLYFCLVLSAGMVMASSIAKIFERWNDPDVHWLSGNVSLVSYVAIWVAFVVLFSLITAGLASFHKGAPPWTDNRSGELGSCSPVESNKNRDVNPSDAPEPELIPRKRGNSNDEGIATLIGGTLGGLPGVLIGWHLFATTYSPGQLRPEWCTYFIFGLIVVGVVMGGWLSSLFARRIHKLD